MGGDAEDPKGYCVTAVRSQVHYREGLAELGNASP